MFQRITGSPRTYFVAAFLLLIVGLAFQVELRIPSRSQGSVEDIAALQGRDDLNVIFILIDTLRSDRLGIYGYDRPTSPHIDGLGRHGVVFKRVLAQSSWTKTSMASLWTGTYPASHGITRFSHAVPEEAVLPAEIFKQAGIRTAGIWRNGWVATNFGFGQGFDIYIRPKAGRERVRVQRNNPAKHKIIGTDEDLLTAASDFLDNFGSGRFFLYLHWMDLHQYVYDDSSPAFGTSYSDIYDQSINWTDRLVSVLVDKIDQMDLLKKTMIVIASDHGEAFEEHGTEGHAKNIFREVTEVPFIIIMPFVLDPGIEITKRVSNVDIWPTVLDLVGLPPLPNTDGISQREAILAAGGAPDAHDEGERPLFAHLDRWWGNPKFEPDHIVGVTDGDLRLIIRDSREEAGIQLFDRSTDPREQKNIKAARPEDVARLKKLIDEYKASGTSPWGAAPLEVELDAMKLEQLRALGYVIK